MKKNFLIFSVLFMTSVICFSQQNNFCFYSKYKCTFSNEDTVSFLNNIEKKIMQKIHAMPEKDASENILLLDGSNSDWTTKISSAQFLHMDSLRKKDTTNSYEMYLLWNNFQDTAQLIGFSRIYKDTTVDNNNKKQVIISPIVYVPLGEYEKIMDNKNFYKFKNIILKSMVDKFHLSLTNIDQFSYIYGYSINKDSLVLSQAPMSLFLDQFEKYPSLINKSFAVYSDCRLSSQLSKKEVTERTSVLQKVVLMGKDTTLLLAAKIKDIRVYEEWNLIPYEINYERILFSPLFRIVRNIKSISIRYETGKELFYDFDEIDKTLRKARINFEAYKNIFRSYLLSGLVIKTRNYNQK